MPPKSTKQNVKNIQKAKISKDVKSYSNDPFVVEKGKASKAFLDKHGFPKETRKLGLLEGKIKISDNFDEPLEDLKDYM